MSIHWTCPFCDRDTTIDGQNIKEDSTALAIPNFSGKCFVSQEKFIVCPNPKCKKVALYYELFEGSQNERSGNIHATKSLQRWTLIPSSKAKVFPEYIPKPIRDDYVEACLISTLSPKASATLSRRCMQGILRDYWKVKPANLNVEIGEIKDKIDPLVYEAIESVRKVGNIGAHMEKDINVIVDVDEKEAELLIGLIETLIEEWYVARQKRKEKLEMIKGVAASKESDRKKVASEN